MNRCRLQDDASGGTPEVSDNSYGFSLAPRGNALAEIKFNPLVSFGRPATLLFEGLIGPPNPQMSVGTPEQRQDYEAAATRLRRAYPDQMAEIALSPATARPAIAATKAQKEPKQKP